MVMIHVGWMHPCWVSWVDVITAGTMYWYWSNRCDVRISFLSKTRIKIRYARQRGGGWRSVVHKIRPANCGRQNSCVGFVEIRTSQGFWQNWLLNYLRSYSWDTRKHCWESTVMFHELEVRLRIKNRVIHWKIVGWRRSKIFAKICIRTCLDSWKK